MAVFANQALGSVAPVVLTTSDVDFYVVPTGNKTIVNTVSLANHSGTFQTARVFFVPSGGAVGTQTAYIFDTSVPANETIDMHPGHVIHAAGKITARAGGAETITIHLSGIEITP